MRIDRFFHGTDAPGDRTLPYCHDIFMAVEGSSIPTVIQTALSSSTSIWIMLNI